ncbi:hypothetical protein QNO00_04490 [Arthrobacter sp. zg-Y1219]|uniref:DUF6541 family protein n=1 Tax=Arthrobacter sp. zg-Y1219 TaxID=3049067 RepID=UPI0024C3A266|nr:DUF6541 family protein [Arthrobacter sp. zg-Y1219]MDK1359524.1 hypothetical protein [Arthrobacter sp. zg-Y1219]
MSWIPALPALLTTAGLVVIPGFAIALCLRFKGFSLLALAPAFSSAVVGVFGVLAGLIGVQWNIWTYLAGTAITALAAFLLTLGGRRRNTPAAETASTGARRENHWRTVWVPVAAVVIAAAMVARRLMQLIGQPDNFAQNFDNVFHLNAIRYIVETGSASSLTLGQAQGEGALGLYPALWHSFAAMTVQLTGASVPLSENSINIVAASLIWPLACVFLVRKVFGTNPVITLAAGVLSAVQVAFPYMLLVWGPVFPTMLAVTMLPLLIGVVVMLARGSALDADQPLRRSWWFALLLGLAGISTAHMSAVNAVLIFALPVILVAWGRAARPLLRKPVNGRKVALFAVVTVAGAAVAAALWMFLRPGFYDHWGPTSTMGGAIGEALTNGPMGMSVNWLVTILAVAGTIYLFHIRQHRWLVVSYAIAVTLYVVDAAVERGFLRNFLTGNWYQDTNRIAGFLPVFATALGAVGAWAIVESVMKFATANAGRLRSGLGRYGKPLGAAALAVGTVGLALVGYFGPVQQYIKEKAMLYSFTEASPLLTPAELELVDQLDEYVPEDSVIAVNPWNGSSMAYALNGREVLTPHLFAPPDPERVLISAELDTFTPEVCAAVEDKNVDYVLDFGNQVLAELGGVEYVGVTDLAGDPGFELVASTGPASSLYRVTGCD